MFNKLVQKRNIILIVYAIVLLVLWTLTLIFGNAEDKIMILVLSLIAPFVIYVFVRLMYRVVRINASPKTMRFFFWFFLIMGIFCTIMMIVEYVTGYPNGLSPALGICGALIIATLDAAKKNSEIESEK